MSRIAVILLVTSVNAAVLGYAAASFSLVGAALVVEFIVGASNQPAEPKHIPRPAEVEGWED